MGECNLSDVNTALVVPNGNGGGRKPTSPGKGSKRSIQCKDGRDSDNLTKSNCAEEFMGYPNYPWNSCQGEDGDDGNDSISESAPPKSVVSDPFGEEFLNFDANFPGESPQWRSSKQVKKLLSVEVTPAQNPRRLAIVTEPASMTVDPSPGRPQD